MVDLNPLRKSLASLHESITNINGCHLEELRDCTFAALDEVYGILDDIVDAIEETNARPCE